MAPTICSRAIFGIMTKCFLYERYNHQIKLKSLIYIYIYIYIYMCVCVCVCVCVCDRKVDVSILTAHT